MKINIFWEKNSKLALALSGGVDSMVLFHLLIGEYKDSYRELVIFHVNHGLREESTQEEYELRELAKKYNIKFFCESLNLKNVKKPANFSEEMYARELRYDFFSKMIAKEQVDYLLTAHHKNDNVENILMRILTGRGKTSRLDIAGIREYDNKFLCRPLINVLKEELLLYAKKHDVSFYEDSTNYDTENYTRNYIRHNIVPSVDKLISSSFDNLINFASFTNDLKEILKKVTKANKEKLIRSKTDEQVLLDSNYYFSLSKIEREEVLLDILATEFSVNNVKKGAIKSIVFNLAENSGNVRYDIKKNLQIIKEYQSIYISKLEKKCYNDKIEIQTINLKTNDSYFFQNKELIFSSENDFAEVGFNNSDLPLIISNRKTGDIIYLGKIKKKLSRFFIDKKVPASIRDALPIVRNKDGIVLGVVGIGETLGTKKHYDYYIKMKG